MAVGRWTVRRAVPLVFPFFNPLTRMALRLPNTHGALSGRVLVLRFAGRRTGRRYAVPIAYSRAEDGALEAVTSVHGAWWRNLEGAASVSVLLGGRVLPARVEVVRVRGEDADGAAAAAVQRGLDGRDAIRRALVLIPPREAVLLRVWVDAGESGSAAQRAEAVGMVDGDAGAPTEGVEAAMRDENAAAAVDESERAQQADGEAVASVGDADGDGAQADVDATAGEGGGEDSPKAGG